MCSFPLRTITKRDLFLNGLYFYFYFYLSEFYCQRSVVCTYFPVFYLFYLSELLSKVCGMHLFPLHTITKRDLFLMDSFLKNQCFSVQYVAMAKCFTAAVVMCCSHSVCCLQCLFLFGLFLVFDWL